MSRLFPHRASIKRSQAIGTNGRRQQVILATDAVCLFVPMASRAEIENGYEIGTGYDVYFKGTGQDVKTGDQLVWDGGTFNIRGVRTYAVPRIGHKHVLATREGA